MPFPVAVTAFKPIRVIMTRDSESISQELSVMDTEEAQSVVGENDHYAGHDMSRMQGSRAKIDGHTSGAEKLKLLGGRRPGHAWGLFSAWLSESLALVISLGCQIALVVILASMNNRPLSDWGGLISLNAMVATLATISKSMILVPVSSCVGQLKWHYMREPHRLRHFALFDDASRGPFGSAHILFLLPFKLVALGAVVTVVASAFSPFSQQVLNFTTRDISSLNTTASFSFAHEYATLTDRSAWELPYWPTLSSLDYSMRGSVVKGLYNLDLTPDFNCSSTCTWDGTYTTLGFGYECSNVTAATLATKLCMNETGHLVDDFKTMDTHNCTMTTPANVSIILTVVPTSEETVRYVTSTTHRDWDPENWYIDYRTTSLGVDFLHLAQYSAQKRQYVEPEEWVASNVTECKIRVTTWDMTGISAQGNSFIISNRTEVLLDPTGRVDAEKKGGTYSPPLNVTFTRPDLSVFINLYDWMSITGFITTEVSELEYRLGESLEGEQAHQGRSNPMLMGDITESVDRMTRSMTDALGSGRNRQLAYGKSQESVVFVEAVWPWMIPSMVTELGALVLLVLTIWKSRSDGHTPLWKSSALALLFSNVERPQNPVLPLVITSDLSSKQDLKNMEGHSARLGLWSADENDDLEEGP
jgi:hypothetical protein